MINIVGILASNSSARTLWLERKEIVKPRQITRISPIEEEWETELRAGRSEMSRCNARL